MDGEVIGVHYAGAKDKSGNFAHSIQLILPMITEAYRLFLNLSKADFTDAAQTEYDAGISALEDKTNILLCDLASKIADK